MAYRTPAELYRGEGTVGEALPIKATISTGRGSKKCKGIGEGLRAFHSARGGQKGHYFVLYCVQYHAKPLAIDMLRLLHDFMDLRRHADHRMPELCYAICIR